MPNARVIVQYADPVYLPLARLTTPRMRAWATRNGWEYHFEEIPTRGPRHPYLHKYTLAARTMEAVASVLYLDVDIVPVRADDLPAFATDLAVSQDAWGICCGVLYFAGALGARTARGLRDLLPDYLEHRREEQDMVDEILRLRHLRPHVTRLGEHLISNPVTPRGYPTPIFRHLWANASLSAAEQAATEAPLFEV